MESNEHRHVSSLASGTDKPGISGRRVTVILVSLLLLVGIWLSYSLWVYSQIDRASSETNVAWRELVVELDQRYRQVELMIAGAVDARDIEMEFGEQFRLAVDRFRTTTQPFGQYSAVRELETLLSGLAGLPAPSPELQAAMDQFNDRLRVQRELLASPGGRFLSIFLVFQEPAEMKLST